jgi:prolyl oligopeptidase
MKPAHVVKIAFLCIGVLCGGWFLLPADSRTPRKPTAREYHGIQVSDEYEWLENGTNPAVRKWTTAQNRLARQALDSMADRRWVVAQLQSLTQSNSTEYSRPAFVAERLFVIKTAPPANQPTLVALASPDDLKSEKTIVDPNVLDPTGGTSIEWFVPSHHGKWIAVCLSKGGSEIGTLHFFETETGKALKDQIPRVQFPTAGGSAVWNADNSGVFYTRYPAPEEQPPTHQFCFQQVYFHAIGTDAREDRYEIGKEFPRIAEIELAASPDGRRILARVAHGDGGEFSHYLRLATGRWKALAGPSDGIQRIEFARPPLYVELPEDPSLFALSHQGAPLGRILQIQAPDFELAAARELIPESTNALVDFKPTASGIALVYSKGGPQQFVYKDFLNPALSGPSSRSDKPDFKIPTGISGLLTTRGDEVLFRAETFTSAPAWWRFDPNKTREHCELTALRSPSPVSFADIETVRATATSKDGTSVPLTIVHRKGLRLDGNRPTLLYGYGGFGIGLAPNFEAHRRIWLDQDGVYAVAHLRGGDEFGARWHTSGHRTLKQNVFDDFAACAEWLVRSNYTRPARLALEGGSNGGLLVGATAVQHPEIARAIVSHVGLFDMLRTELDPNGQFNVTEYGSVQDPDQFKALHAYSPYHQVRPGTPYPAMLFLSGENDGRVNPSHSRKMVARLQSATSSKWPILLRTSANSGHGFGTPLGEHLEQVADVYAFLFSFLDVEFSLLAHSPWSGALTPKSAIVKARLKYPNLSTRLWVSKDPNFTRPLQLGPAQSQSSYGNVVSFAIPKLEPDTSYHYAFEIEGRLERRKAGSFKTLPSPGPASFQFAFASCARTGSTREVFDRIRELQPLFFLHMGDFHYLDIQTNDLRQFRAAYDQVLASPQQSDLYRQVPIIYMWDDHDYGGNSATKKSKTHEAARRAYEEIVPHYPLVQPSSPTPIHHSFTVGRVKFILTDLRSERDDPKKRDGPSKSMMGEDQKRWFKQELLSANGKYPLICWISTIPWVGTYGKSPYARLKPDVYGFIHHTNSSLFQYKTNRDGTVRLSEPPPGEEDHWSAFATERREIADFIAENHIQGLCIVHGDSHMLAADDGSNSDYSRSGHARIPVMCAGPLEQNPSIKGGPYSQGVYRVRDSKGESAFGLMSILDLGDRIEVVYSGRNQRNEEKISLQFAVPAKPVPGSTSSKPR